MQPDGNRVAFLSILLFVILDGDVSVRSSSDPKHRVGSSPERATATFLFSVLSGVMNEQNCSSSLLLELLDRTNKLSDIFRGVLIATDKTSSKGVEDNKSRLNVAHAEL